MDDSSAARIRESDDDAHQSSLAWLQGSDLFMRHSAAKIESLKRDSDNE